MKIEQPSVITIKYFSIKYDDLKDRLKMLKELEKYVLKAEIFHNMTTVWIKVKGKYFTDPALYPNESVTDFTDILSEYYYKELSSVPQPENRWIGKWESIDNTIERLNKILTK